jgi:DNA-binding transcriptional ArsR family regulator
MTDERQAAAGTCPPLSADAAEAIAERFRALAEPTRLRIVYLLRDGERSVGDLARALGCSQANASKQISLLAEAGLVRRRRQGLHCFCAVADPAVFALCDAVCAAVRRHWDAKAGGLRDAAVA